MKPHVHLVRPASYLNRRDIDFLLYEWLCAETLIDREAFKEHSRTSFDAVLDLSDKLATTRFSTHFKKADREEPRLLDEGVKVISEVGAALGEYARVGFFASSFSADHGGVQLPHLVATASYAYFAAANIATSAYAMLTMANARLLVRYGSPHQVKTWAIPQIEGRFFGTMCLSEAQAGSSLADIATRAISDGEDQFGQRYRIVGNKMWISGGDHDLSENIVHLVLAKIQDSAGRIEPGIKGISLFVVPRTTPDGAPNDVVVAGLNHKMGYRAIANCALNFGERMGARGWLVGRPGDGLAVMFRMMNEARIMVGVGAAALAYRGFRQSLDYATTRRQGRRAKDGARDPTAIPCAIIEHADVKLMLLAQKAYAEGALGLVLYCASLLDDRDTHPDPSRRTEATVLLELLTPIAKSWPAEWGVKANDLAIQVHGGYGYTRDYDVEQLYRDNRLNSIHEGTHGIQAIDLLNRKVLRDGGEGLRVLRERIETTLRHATVDSELAVFATSLRTACDTIVQIANSLRRGPTGTRALENASLFLSTFGHVVVSWIWLEQAVAARHRLSTTRGDHAFYKGKIHACRYFFEWELPRVYHPLTLLGEFNDCGSSMPQESY